jgi:group I intron endonuclease
MNTTIYAITNKVTNQVYIGQTTQTLRARFTDHCNLNKSTGRSKIRAAIKEYGKSNFDLKAIVVVEPFEADRVEELCIEKFNTLYPNGYNLQTGGRCGKVHPTTREKLSKACLGRKLTAAHKEKIRQANKGKIMRIVKVVCVETGVIYENRLAACAATGISSRQMLRLMDSERTSPRFNLTFKRIIVRKQHGFAT